MTARTSEQLLQSISAKIDAQFGNNPLNDPITNRSNNLVKLVNTLMTGQAELEKRLEAFKFQYQQKFIEGDALDFLGSTKCIDRVENTTSKSLVVVTGEDCAVLQAGSVLTDSISREWQVQEDITLSANGTPCAFGVGVVEATASGCWLLREGELSFDNSNTPQIYSATNSVMLEKGGIYESNDRFRERISNTGPLSLINGTGDNIQSAISQIDGVDFVRVDSGTFCGESGGLIVVKGGLDADICETIKLKAGLSCALIGDTSCSTNCFDEIRFQRPIPVKVDIEVTLNDDCPIIDQTQAETIIRAQSLNFSKSTKISGSFLSKLHPDIENIRFRTIRQEISCGSDAEYVDPFTGDTLPFFTSQAFGINSGSTSCHNENQVYSSTAKFPIYEMPIMNDINFTSAIESGDCNPCV